MRLVHEQHTAPLFNATERRELWAARQADSPLIVQASAALGLVITVFLITGAGPLPPQDWGSAAFVGLATAVTLRGLILAARYLASGGWRSWRQYRANEAAIDRLSFGGALALFLCLATGGNGIGPAIPVIEATIAAIGAGLLVRGFLMLVKWP